MAGGGLGCGVGGGVGSGNCFFESVPFWECFIFLLVLYYMKQDDSALLQLNSRVEQ